MTHQDLRLSDAVRRWLAADDIVAPSGAYYAWYDADTHVPAFEYPEITGYALTHLAGQVDPSAVEVARAAGAADWLVGRWDAGVHAAHDGWEGDGVYFFDLAMIVNGLLLAGQRWSRRDAVRVGLEMATLLADDVLTHGELRPLPAGQSTTRRGWSVDGLAHMGKALQGLHHAAAVSPSPQLSTAIAKVVAQTLAMQQADGRFVTEAADERTMLHPHFYAVEGLWCHAQAAADAGAARAARAGTQWAWTHQLASGGLPRDVPTATDEAPGPEQLDLTCQAVRAAALTRTSLDAAGKAAVRIGEVCEQVADDVAALPYQPGSGRRHLNAWVSLFGCQALGLLDEPAMLDWRLLV